jgi:hypothetical protein
LKIAAPGPFQSGVKLWLQDNGLRDVDIAVQGIAK